MAFRPDKCNILSITQNKNLIKYSLHGQLESLEEAKYHVVAHCGRSLVANSKM
jgi:hypothetical protein